MTVLSGNPCFVGVVIHTDAQGEQVAWHYVFFDEGEANTVITEIVGHTAEQYDSGFVAGKVYPGSMFLPTKATAN